MITSAQNYNILQEDYFQLNGKFTQFEQKLILIIIILYLFSAISSYVR